MALRDIADEPMRPGSVARPEIGSEVRSYHIRFSRRRVAGPAASVRTPRHLILYRVMHPGLIGVGRVLHDRMELERHLPASYGDQ